MAISATSALVSSKLDYCNSLYWGLSKRLQCLQNVLARVVTGSRKWTHVTPVLKSLHWLPVKERIVFKTATIIYKHFDSGLLRYFPTFNFQIHKSKTHFDRSFANDGPRLWNSLPFAVQSAPTLAFFRRELKAHQFYKAYPSEHPLLWLCKCFLMKTVFCPWT